MALKPLLNFGPLAGIPLPFAGHSNAAGDGHIMDFDRELKPVRLRGLFVTVDQSKTLLAPG